MHCHNCCGRELRTINKAKQSLTLPTLKILDKNGNPLMVAAIVVYSFQNTKRVAIDMMNAGEFVRNQALATLRQVVSKYPYEKWEGDSGSEDEHCLKTEPDSVSQDLIRTLQKHVSIAGAKIHSFQLNELSYASEVASAMLKRQQAESLVAARSTVVNGATQIALDAAQQLDIKGIKMPAEEKAKLVSSLLTVICSESQVVTTINLG